MLAEAQNAVFGYAKRPIVRVERLALQPGRCLGVFGPNGAGKTTLVRGIVGLLEPMEGSVTRRANLRFGYLPQHRAMELHWPMTGLDAASMAISATRRFGWVGRDVARVRDCMTTMGVEQLARQPFAKLSGGQQQRLLLAGALATSPDALILDEPTDGLDVRSRRMLLDTLHAQNRAGLRTVMISHEVEDLLYLADEIAWLRLGDENEPSTVETIDPDELRERVTKVRHAS